MDYATRQVVDLHADHAYTSRTSPRAEHHVYDVLHAPRMAGLDVTLVSNVTDTRTDPPRTIEEGAAVTRSSPSSGITVSHGPLGVLRPDQCPRHRVRREMVAFQRQLIDGVSLREQRGSTSREALRATAARRHRGVARAGARSRSTRTRRVFDFALGRPSRGTTWRSSGARDARVATIAPSCARPPRDGFDLHTAGEDLTFPHHENERAQAVGAGHTFARHWTHHAMVEVGGQKMSKSLKNFTTLTDLLDRHDPRAYRLLVLRAHYRKPMEVSPDTMVDAEMGMARLDAFARHFADTAAAPDQAYLALRDLRRRPQTPCATGRCCSRVTQPTRATSGRRPPPSRSPAPLA